MGRIVLPLPIPKILLMSERQHSQTTPPPPATLQTIKVQEKVKIDFTSDNTEVYNKPFRLRYLRRLIMKAKPCAPGPDGIHNNLLKHLPEDKLKILKEILNKMWTFGRFSQSVESSNGDPDPQTKQGPYWPSQLQTKCTDQLPVQGLGAND